MTAFICITCSNTTGQWANFSHLAYQAGWFFFFPIKSFYSEKEQPEANCYCLNRVQVFYLLQDKERKKYKTKWPVLLSDHIPATSLKTSACAPTPWKIPGSLPDFLGSALPTPAFQGWLSFVLTEAKGACSNSDMFPPQCSEVLWKLCHGAQSYREPSGVPEIHHPLWWG